MAGTYEGGVKASETNKQRYGEDFYKEIGAKGGKISKGGGFANHDLAVRAGGLGRRISKRGKVNED